MRKALLVGVEQYEITPLKGCEKDTISLANILARNDDTSSNFTSELLISSEIFISERKLKYELVQLFNHESDIVLFYFSGHGAENEFGGYLVTQDGEQYNEGVAVNDIINLANKSKAREVIIILDCCFAGKIGNLLNFEPEIALLRKGISIITSSRGNEFSSLENGRSLFSKILCDALNGGAADLLGNVSLANIYTYADKLLNAWEQRPIFKSHVTKMVSLRKCKPKIPLGILKNMIKYFPYKDYVYQLTPFHEPTIEPRDFQKEKEFYNLQKYTSCGLVEPEGEEHMYFAAINEKSCRLTALGKFYWEMIVKKKI